MRRLFWVGLGAAVGIVVARRITRAAESFTPVAIGEAVGESVREVGDALRYFAEQVRLGMAERETELYEALGVLPDGRTARPAAVPEVTR